MRFDTSVAATATMLNYALQKALKRHIRLCEDDQQSTGSEGWKENRQRSGE